MEYSIENPPLEKLQTQCIIVGIYENQQLTPSAAAVNEYFDGIIHRILERGDLQGKSKQTVLLNYIAGSSVERILLVGLGKKEALSTKKYRQVVHAALTQLKNTQTEQAVCALAELDVTGHDWTWKSRQIIEIAGQITYQCNTLKTNNNSEIKLKKLHILAPEHATEQTQTGLQQGQAIADGIRLAKQLADLPGNICTPTYLAEQAQTLANTSTRLSVEILEEADMQELAMGALLSVSRGSRQPAKLIVVNYKGSARQNKPIVLIGKGLTFDAGGISLKPGAGMDEMKYDMCGGASVLGAISAASALELPINIVGLIPASENLPDGDANKPGDIVTSMSGKTIEILNTDAEGRLILCDTLTYAQKFDPEVVIDMATLTGACIVALGRQPSGLMGNDDELCDDLIKASKTACDPIWRLPVWEEYQEQLKSNFADMANIGGRDAGTITAACFLARFAEDYRWAHLDIAGTAWRTGKDKGATGRPVPLLCQYLLDQAAKQAN